MIVAVALFELHIEDAQSLKEKRMVVRSLRDRLRRRFRISVNEVAFHDLHQRARLAVALIAQKNRDADSLLDAVERFVDENAGARMTGWTSEKLDFDAEAPL
jgi:uncharacterized protein YlxP (DUF503 family)